MEKYTDQQLYKMISDNVSMYRSYSKMTQRDLAFKANISLSYLSKIEAGKCDKSFSIATLNHIANALGIEICVFFVPGIRFRDRTTILRRALENLGGKATYADIFKEYERITGSTLTQIDKAGIRRAISSHSSDSENYLGRGDYFYSVEGIGKGVWGLRDN